MRGKPLNNSINRRRALSLFAIGAGVSMLGVQSGTASAFPNAGLWEGQALGGDASIRLLGFEPQDCTRLLNQCVARLRELESIFSLFDADSNLVRLNTQGHLQQAPAPLLDVMRLSKQLHQQTDGAFDPTVQALWNATAHHFQTGASPSYLLGRDTQAKVGFEKVHVNGSDIHLEDGAELTFNGIAQGYITDQITDLLDQAGARHVLVNLGEFRALGPQENGLPWQVGVRDPQRIWGVLERLPLSAGAIATSAASGQQFDRAGLHHHLFDPSTGQNTQRYKSVSVWAPNAARADGLSTAFSVMAEADIQKLAAQDGNVGVLLQHRNGQLKKFGSWTQSYSI